MKKRLIILVGMLAVLLISANSALAQAFPPGTITVAGVLERVDTGSGDGPSFSVTDEASGQEYLLLAAPDSPLAGSVGERVIVDGILRAAPGGTVLDVVGFTPERAGGPPPDDVEMVTVTFELTVEGKPPADATFFGAIGGGGAPRYVPLTDPDSDGVYTGSEDFAKARPAPAPGPGATVPDSSGHG